MKKYSKFVALLLAVALMCSMTSAFAAQPEVTDTNSSHTHDFSVQIGFHYSYMHFNDYQHVRVKLIDYKCSVEGCNLVDSVESVSPREYQSHTYSNFAYTGYNYHSGTQHYAQYARSCSICGFRQTKMESYPCPGNGNCITPTSITPELVAN